MVLFTALGLLIGGVASSIAGGLVGRGINAARKKKKLDVGKSILDTLKNPFSYIPTGFSPLGVGLGAGAEVAFPTNVSKIKGAKAIS